MIKAPYNFVPLYKDVFFPNWANEISQDIPFSDGISGSIKLKITAETPIFVRNGHTREDADEKNDNYKSFSKTDDGQFFIPATSIKGCIRNVLEIMSFGKMTRMSNNRYSIRDLQLKKYLSYFQNMDVHCGWMTKQGEQITITDNGIPRRISHKDIDSKFQTDFCTIFSNQDLLKDDSKRSALYKYRLIKKNSQLVYKFKELPLNSKNPSDERIRVVFDDDGKEGTVVFTGQSDLRREGIKKADGTNTKATGKFYEFVFFKECISSYTLNSEEENGLYEDFCFVYKKSEEWKYWKKKMDEGESVPIFFSVKDKKLLHFGLSYLYKLPFNKRIKEYLPEGHKKVDMDLCECIFGKVGQKNSLKGRVQFSNAFCIKGKPFDKVVDPYMGSPKPTYYPIYLRQNGINGDMVDKNGVGVCFTTMLDENARLKGWKRYPIQEDWQEDFQIQKGQEDNTNPFYPMSVGSEFTSFIRIFNLRRNELGALLNAIELRPDYYHSIGFAKAYGYGKISIKIEEVSGFDISECLSLKHDFQNMMEQQITNYMKSPQMKELLSMMHVQDTITPLEYMELDDFVKYKKQHLKEDKNQCFGEYLQDYSELIKKEKTEQKSVEIVAEAVVSLWDKRYKQARLIEGKDKNTKLLDVADYKIKLKTGDKIEVRKIMNSGNVIKLIFIRKL